MAKERKEILLYIIFGALTTAVNYIVYFMATRIFSCHYLFANALAWILAVLFSYITNRRYVFESNGVKPIKEFLLFSSSRVLSWLVDSLIMFIGLDLFALGKYEFIVKTFAQAFVIVLNYLMSKFIIFKKDE